MEKKLLKQLFNEQINPAFNTDPLFTFLVLIMIE